MRPFAELILVLLLPTAAMFVLVSLPRAWGWAADRHRSRVAAQRAPTRAESIAVLTERLRRLRAELEQTETSSGVAAKQHRVRAVRGAYLDTLSAACRQLSIDPPAGGDRASQAGIYRAEAALRERGIDVRGTAVR